MINPGFLYILGAGGLYITKGKLRQALALIISLVTFLVVIGLSVGEVATLPFMHFELVLLEVTEMSRVFALIFAFFGLCAVIYSLVTDQKKHYVLSFLYIGSSLAVVYVGDLFTFYVFWELMTITSYFLIFDKSKKITKQASYYYFVMHMVGAMALLWGILLQYTASGSIALTTVEYGLPFFVVAVGIKLAFIGLHTWLPRNYANVPFYTSVVLSAFTTKVGVYGLYRLLGGINLGHAGTVSAIIGVIFALKQTNVRKLLSYHIVSQIGFMVAAIGVGTHLGIIGGVLHLVNNILYKGLLFMMIGVVIYTTGEDDLMKFGGLAKKLPITAFCGLVASLAIAGFPFTNGYISKYIMKAGISDPFVYWGLNLAGVGTSLSFLKVMYFGFFKTGRCEVELKRKPKKSMLFSMLIVVIPILVIGWRPQVLQTFFDLEAGMGYFDLGYIWAGFRPILLAVILFIVGHDIITPHHHEEHDRDILARLGKSMDYSGRILSRLHNGNMSRYVLWLLTTLAILWIRILI
ncbi:proton-conducting transporter transmembrane domain-containing protein [Fuchsiella alkaliacetigena]|uniref:proton-conducting transporter transmembrane domain-containing protein n=1 Tax=Fuchsiella alkaliacetigena TaxID=957042 RepID=UPI00200B6C9E|nr:proton-conducting transporter membrane subunit [Fuchsiella alkaliacetigena]MCK8825935.1 hypothetical protein [Fuchsiella alkaliacetigena]